MIVEVKQKEIEKDFPKLMINKDGLIVLFKAKAIGMVLKAPNKSYYVGYYSNCWNTDNFQDFEGQITIKND